METQSFRILIADSFEAWRRYASSTLEKDERLQIVGVASDGLEAVQKAIELRPDLVLLSVGLSPHLNGIEAAKRIIKAVPDDESNCLSPLWITRCPAMRRN